jgi:hypothetical protein
MLSGAVVTPPKKRCPLCHNSTEKYSVEPENLIFLTQLEEQGVLNDYLKICRVYLDILNQGAPTTAVLTKSINAMKSEISRVASDEFSKTTTSLILRMQETLRSQTPDPKSMETLIKTLPELTLAIHELLRKQYIPLEKGSEAEKTLRDELASYFPEDEVTHLGGPGDTDILIQPRMNGVGIIEPIMVESKSNKTWDRSYYAQIGKHMRLKQSHYAVLVVETLPRGANGYLTEYFEEGTVFVTERAGCKAVYGALRAILFSENTLSRRAVGLKRVLSDERISQAIKRTLTSASYFESIRKHCNAIITNGKGISQDADDAEKLLRTCLAEMQRVIAEALESQVHSFEAFPSQSSLSREVE